MLPVLGGEVEERQEHVGVLLQGRDGLWIPGPVLACEPPDRVAGLLAALGVHHLVLTYFAFMRERGSQITRHLIQPEGEAKPIFSDIYDATRNNLLEAKGTVTREAIRMAIGQLADYRRFIEPRPRCAVLLPERPRSDLETLLATEGVAIVWPVEGDKFEDNMNGAFT